MCLVVSPLVPQVHGTPLMAVLRLHRRWEMMEIMELLLEKEADVNQQDHVSGKIFLFLRSDHMVVLIFLQKRFFFSPARIDRAGSG